MADPAVMWTTPAPLWPEVIYGSEQASHGFPRPAILRFASDNFMQEYLTLLEGEPSSLSSLLAKPETWRGPGTIPEPVKRVPGFRRAYERRLAAQTLRPKLSASTLVGQLVGRLPAELKTEGTATPPPLKLYQPAHLRYYLVTACLVCKVPGLPDRVLNTASQEQVSFVIRRLIPKKANVSTRDGPGDADEYALVTENRQSGWQKVNGDGKTTVPGEERLPLFPTTFTQVDGRRRRIFAGVLPVGRREAYLGAAELVGGTLAGDGGQTLKPGELLFLSKVIEPWKQVLKTAAAAKDRLNPPAGSTPSNDAPLPENDGNPRANFLKVARSSLQTSSWYILLDFARLLEQYLPEVWKEIRTPGSTGLGESALLKAIKGSSLTLTKDQIDQFIVKPHYSASDVVLTLDEALRKIRATQAVEDKLESVTLSYDRGNPAAEWPKFLFPMADPLLDQPLPPGTVATHSPGEVPLPPAAEDRIQLLADLIAQALPAQTSTGSPAVPLGAQPVKDTREAWFQVRFVFEQPECDPRLSPPIVSEPSAMFQMAGFFDPDAPARPIRIALPIDTTPAGLRKFDKNTVFMISDVLCGQIDRFKGMTLGDLVRSVLPWPLHKDLSAGDNGPCNENGLSIGMMCSLSIPIITICALILLIIIVSLLDIVFHWIPYFILCFPVPKFGAKESSA